MTDQRRRGISERVRLWVAAIGIPVVIALLGYWQFYLKEVLWPVTAINLSTEVSLKHVGLSGAAAAQEKNFEAIELTITAHNPSSNTIYLCANYWTAWGVTINEIKQYTGKSGDFLKRVTKLINDKDRNLDEVSTHFKRDHTTFVSGGTLLADLVLRANETVRRTIVFYVRENTYDFVEVKIKIPTTSRESPAAPLDAALVAEHKMKEDGDDLEIVAVYKVLANGKREKLSYDQEEKLPLPKHDMIKYGWQVTTSTVDLALPRRQPSPPAKTAQPQSSPP